MTTTTSKPMKSLGRTDIRMHDHILKYIILGDSGVGKTCLLLKFAESYFAHNHLSTIGIFCRVYSLGIDVKIKKRVVDGKLIKMQIWDTAGQERFRTITQTYYRNVNGIVLAFDLTSEKSFSNVKNWAK
jgi:small GTP-binding protein